MNNNDILSGRNISRSNLLADFMSNINSAYFDNNSTVIYKVTIPAITDDYDYAYIDFASFNNISIVSIENGFETRGDTADIVVETALIPVLHNSDCTVDTFVFSRHGSGVIVQREELEFVLYMKCFIVEKIESKLNIGIVENFLNCICSVVLQDQNLLYSYINKLKTEFSNTLASNVKTVKIRRVYNSEIKPFIL